MLRILLIEDDTSLLEVLHRSLTKREPEWQVVACHSSREALSLLEHEEFQVVLTDLLMPDVDGEQILRTVAQTSPQTLRLLHSGSVDSARIVEALGVAHNLFEKPCRVQDVIAVVKRAERLRRSIDSTKICQLISGSTSVPAIPQSFFAIQKLLVEDDFYLPRLVEVIQRDLSVSTVVLKAANSAYFGAPAKITTVEKALIRLGVNTVKSLVFYSELFGQIPERTIRRFGVNALMDESLQVGDLARNFCRQLSDSTDLHEEVFLAGVLHDIGKLLLIQLVPKQYAAALKMEQEEGMDILETERQVLGATHEQVGAYFGSIWGLPTSLVEAIAFHHQPYCCYADQLTPLAFVAAAKQVLYHGEEPSTESDGYFSKIGLSEKLIEWREQYS
jgi:HD-like signal output (HDOD) protein